MRPEAEIVSVDSMCVYRGMDIGTAKATPMQRHEVRHHLVDVVEPNEEFTVHDFQRCAGGALADIGARGNRALLVGGTGLYLRAVVDDLELPGRWPEVARALEAEAGAPDGLATLYARLVALDPVAAARIEPGNRRRIAARPRGHHRFGSEVLLVRSRARGLSAHAVRARRAGVRCQP